MTYQARLGTRTPTAGCVPHVKAADESRGVIPSHEASLEAVREVNHGHPPFLRRARKQPSRCQVCHHAWKEHESLNAFTAID